MALKERIAEEDIALLDVIEDEVFLGEFLRNTANGESNKELWPKGTEFKYRNYQREWLTDTSPYVCVVAGRSVGKCSPATARIYTDKGYRTISQLRELPSFYAYALDSKNELVLRRAKVYPNKDEPIFTLTTESGRSLDVNKEHPFLTPNGDWVKLKNLKAGEHIAVVTRLPELKNNYYFQWHELRWLGYYLLNKVPSPEIVIKMRFRKQIAELRLIAKKFNAYLKIHNDREVQIKRHIKQHYLRNNATWLLREMGYSHKLATNGTRQFPPQLMELPNEPLKVFLEALFSQYANLSLTAVTLQYPYKIVVQQIQEMLLRFGIESRIEKIEEEYKLSLYDTRAIYRFYTTFDLPGVSVGTIPLPPPDNDTSEHIRFEEIKSIVQRSRHSITYAVYVYDCHNYISENIYVHNSLVLEDKIVYETINADKEFPVTREQLLSTANQAQLNPILDRLITRFSNGRLLQSFLNNQVNKSQGTMKFPVWNMIFTARIAAGKGESNLVGLHLPRIKVDEGQLFPLAAYTQMIPSLNDWEPKTQVMVTGVPNGLRNTILYFADQKFKKYKKYRIPSHNNPYYTRQNDIENTKRFGGENSDEYQQLILGRHGSAAQQVLNADSIKRQSFDFYSYRFTSNNKVKGETFEMVLDRPRLPEGLTRVYLSMDSGYVDPSVLNIWGQDKKGIWRNYVRYRLQRIDYPEQERILNWLDDYYNFSLIGLDIGAGGNGASLMQGLCTREEYKSKRYDKRTVGINNGESVVVGRNDTTGNDIKKDVKSVGTEELVRRIEDSEIIFSEIDAEGTSELEKIAKQRGITGVDKYFIMSDSGKGKSGSDHHYASCIVFAMMIRDETKKRKKKLGRSFNG